jgi:hypothetical protein
LIMQATVIGWPFATAWAFRINRASVQPPKEK